MGQEPGTILVVEDDPIIQRLLLRALSIKGFSVKIAGNGVEGLEVLESDPSIRLILLDLMMPVMDGFEFLQKLKELGRTPKIPVVVLSAAGPRANEAPADFVLHKPIPLDELYRTVEIYLLEQGAETRTVAIEGGSR